MSNLSECASESSSYIKRGNFYAIWIIRMIVLQMKNKRIRIQTDYYKNNAV
jgi:hypothetical protein